MAVSFSRPRLLTLALFCWILVLAVPTTRHKLVWVWNSNQREASRLAYEDEEGSFDEVNRVAKDLSQSLPQNRALHIFVTRADEKANQLLERYPNDAFVITMALRERFKELDSDRVGGPLTNSGYPASVDPVQSPRVKWNEFLALARRGQQQEPDNSFFSWMQLYALCATRQDEASRELLAKAVRQTLYDDHSREQVLNNIAVLRLAYGSPFHRRHLGGVLSNVWQPELSRFRQTSRWLMEGVIADRQQGRPERALKTALDLLHLGRIMRRDSYSLLNSIVGTACQATVLFKANVSSNATGSQAPPLGASLAQFHSDPNTLYSFAKSQNRRDVQQALDREWVEIGQWRQLSKPIMDQNWTGITAAQTLALVATERLAALTLRVLPSVLLLGLVFSLLSLRQRGEFHGSGAWWSGTWFGLMLLLAALVCDAAVVWRAFDPTFDGRFEWTYAESGGLIMKLPSWPTYGLALVMVCLGFNRAVAWQKKLAGENIPLRSRLQSLFAPPDDRLARFDFGWVLGLAARATGWVLLLGAASWVFSYGEFMYATEVNTALLTVVPMVSVGLSLRAWRGLPRHEPLSFNFRFVAESLAGFFVALSLAYALLAFVTLPFAFSYERTFEQGMERGEVAIARDKLGI